MGPRSASIGTAFAILLSVPGCGGESDDGDDRERIDVAVPFGVDAASTADELGFERAEEELGVEVELTETGDTSATIAGLARGDFELGQAGVREAVEAIQQGAPVRVVIGAEMVPDFVLLAARDIREPADLRGARLAYHGPGSDTEAMARVAVERAGLKQSEVKFTVLPESPNRASALTKGRIDAAVLESIDVQRVMDEDPGLNLLAEMRDFYPRSVSDGWLVHEELIEEDPELVGDLVEAMLDGYLSLYSGEGRQEWLDETGATVLSDETEERRESVLDHLLEIEMWPRREEPVTAKQYDAAIDFWLENDLLEEPLPFERVWDISFWRRAAD